MSGETNLIEDYKPRYPQGDELIIYESLQKDFPCQQIVGPREMAIIKGMKLRTVYNEVQAGKFEPKPFRVNGRPKWKLLDVARHLASLGE
jgi:hypothetical protein